MTNLEAMIKAHGWQGGTIHQVDIMYERPLRKAGFRSLSDLKDLSDWLDLLVIVFEEAKVGICNLDFYIRTKNAYLYRFGGKK